MKTKTVYSLATGQAETAYESPLEPDVFLLPANTTEEPPPEYDAETQTLLWDDAWLINDIPQPEPTPEPTPEEQAEALRMQRKDAYQNESDPLFFKAQRGEATMEEWQAKVAEIKARYPK